MTVPAGSVLHVPFIYFPEPAGGTEVYVRNLARALRNHGYSSCIAAPGRENVRYDHDGEQVYRFAADRSERLELAYGVPDEVAAMNFRNVLDELHPGIVHLHARTAAVSERLCEAAHAAGARVVFTYHTPTASCARGTMMLYGQEPCDGLLGRHRCTACALAARGVPRGLGALAAHIPVRLSASLAAVMPKSGKPAAALRTPALIAQNQERFRSLMAKVDHVVALCRWTQDVLARNGVPDDKITVSLHGIPKRGDLAGRIAARDWNGPLRLAYFGRLDHGKGPDLLVRAVAAIPGTDVILDLFAIPDNAALARQIECFVASDRRLTLRPAVAADAVQEIMTSYDLIAIPSRWLETGPLVALEAFAAGVPVLGANLGGIAENVRDGIDGVLVRPDDVEAWSAAILRFAANRSLIDQMRRNIRPQRSADEVARDMARIYRRLGVGGP
jgi:glycosyltransferase involved in cell wall biosynthesis